MFQGDNPGFDIVIANPPYINVEKLGSDVKKFIFNHYKTCSGRTDIYISFIERSFFLIKNNGFISFITPYALTNQKYGMKLRELLINYYHVDEILDLSNYFVFEEVTVKNIVMFCSKRKIAKSTIIKVAKSQNNFLKNKLEIHNIKQQKFLKLKDYRFETKNLLGLNKIKEKVWNDSFRFDKICFVAYGARLNHKNKKISKNKYIFTCKNDGTLKPYIEGKSIQRYKITQYGWLLYKPREHYNPMFKELFDNEKIVFINVVKDRLRFALDTNHFYNSHTVINCVRWNLLKNVNHISVKRNINTEKKENGERYDYRFLLGVLNSNLIDWYFKHFLSEKLHFYPDDAKQIPIKEASRKEQKPFINVVDKILNITKFDSYLQNQDEKTEIKKLETRIDQLVYELYNLTEEEIEIIEKSYKK